MAQQRAKAGDAEDAMQASMHAAHLKEASAGDDKGSSLTPSVERCKIDLLITRHVAAAQAKLDEHSESHDKMAKKNGRDGQGC